MDSHYDYEFTVKVGDSVTEKLTFGGDGTYTVSGVNGNVEVTVTSKTPKKYDVTYRYLVNFKDLEVPEEILKGPAKATYNEDYSFSIRPRNDTSYGANPRIRRGHCGEPPTRTARSHIRWTNIS